MGVASLPDNKTVAMKAPEAKSSGGQEEGELHRKVSEKRSSTENKLRMKRQLQASFSNLEDFELEFKVIEKVIIL